MSVIDYDKLFVSLPYCESAAQCESLTMFEEADSYLIHVRMDFYLEDEGSASSISLYGENTPATKVATLHGTLILGHQISHDAKDMYSVCDDCSDDLEALETEVEKEGIILSKEGLCRDIFYIDELEMSKELIDAANVRSFFDLLPQAVFMHCNIMPELMCYLIASVDGYYQNRASTAELDQRSVDGFSPLLFTENGYTLSESGNIIYQETEDFTLPIL